jgi:hypothetical protein
VHFERVAAGKMSGMDSTGRSDTFLRALTNVSTMQHELTTEQRPTTSSTFLDLAEQLKTVAQAISRFLELLLNPSPEMVTEMVELIMTMKVLHDAMQAYGGDEEAIFRTLVFGRLEREPD